MGPDLERLLQARTWRAFDVDDEGRVLAGWDGSGSMQLVELDAAGAHTLTALPHDCTGRYLAGERAVLVAHDEHGDERTRLSLLWLDPPLSAPAGEAELTPLVGDPKRRAVLADVAPGRIVYRSDRDDADIDVLIRGVLSGAEETGYAAGGRAREARMSPHARYLAVVVAREVPLADDLYIVDTMPEVEGANLRCLTADEPPARYTEIGWLTDDLLLVGTDRGREFTGLACYQLSSGSWRWLCTDDEHDLLGRPAPDGSRILVETNVDGVSRLSVHDQDGALLHEVATPVPGWIGHPLPQPVWSPNSRFVTLSLSAPAGPGEVLLLDLHGEQLHQLTDSATELAGLPLTPPVSHRLSTEDGHELPLFSYSPQHSTDAAVLVLPGGQATHRFDPVVQALTGHGYTVITPNVRDSRGHGGSWCAADDDAALSDLSTVYEWLTGNGFDPARLALWGHPDAAHLTQTALARQPRLWAAGVSEAATALSTADVAAPLLVLHGANDPTAGEQPAGEQRELLVYQDDGRGLTKRANRLHAYPQAIAFLDRVLGTR